MINKLGLQLWTIRSGMNDEKSLDESFAKMAALGYTEAHTAGNSVDAELFGKLAKKNGVQIIGTHYDYNKIINNVDETLKIHEMWGTTNIGVGGMPGEARNSYDNLMKFIETYNNAAKEYAKYGYKLTYHNHSFEFIRINDNKTIFDYLYENLDPENISFVLDTCWVAHGGADVRYWMEKLNGRIDILHLKDIKAYYDENGKVTQTMTEIGNGNIWWDGVLDVANKIGVKHYVVEQDANFIDNDPFKSIKASADYLKKYTK